MVRKIFKTGNSFVVSLPREALQHLDLQEGSEVSVVVDREKGRIIVEPVLTALPGVDADFAEQLDDFIERYRPALEALAK